MEQEKASITWRISEEQKAKLVEKFGSASGKTVPDEILNTYFIKFPELQARVTELEAEVETLKEAASVHEAAGTVSANAELQEKINSLESALKLANEETETYKQQVTNLNSLLEEKVTTIKELSAKADDPSVIAIVVENPIIRNFLDAVKSHLEDLYERKVSYYEIFVMTTLLYNIEQRCDWFYPPLKRKEIERITGKSIREWEHFLSQKED